MDNAFAMNHKCNQLQVMKINKTLATTLIALTFFSLLYLPTLSVTAKNVSDVLIGLDQTATEAKITKVDSTGQPITLFGITGKFIFLVLGVLGSLFLILTIYGGLTWMTAAGNEDKISKARSTVIHAVIGLIIVLAAYLLTNFVIFQLSDNLTTGGTTVAPVANPDLPCLNLNGVCQNNATVGGACTVGSTPGTYQTGKCLSNSSPTYLCCVPN